MKTAMQKDNANKTTTSSSKSVGIQDEAAFPSAGNKNKIKHLIIKKMTKTMEVLNSRRLQNNWHWQHVIPKL